LGTSPIFFFIFFFLGLAAGVLNVYRTMSRIK
jgi:F0F1-type ATP synthase assembly protein I